ncbi:hypothetical protein ABDK00_014150 [Niabella insulamsoli]|uniref:hypothetical protein n=1 Tax=Niabella insulamsoli TaxID=3144874 RepID=UPI0031FD7798
MAKKIEITEKQKAQFNRMLQALQRIKAYQSPDRLRKNSDKDWGLEYEEALEMAYENMQTDASNGCKSVRPL